MMVSCRLCLFCFVAMLACFGLATSAYAVNIDFADPSGGWDYAYQGDFNPGIGGLPDGYGDGSPNALDGTWAHDQGDKWDGTAPGDTLSNPGDPAGTASTPEGGSAGTSPGGAGSFTDGPTDYVRIQDTGNPEIYGWTQGTNPENTNRRVYFGHDMQANEGVADELIMTNTGVTISFRTRIPDSGPIDDRVYLETVGDDADFNSNLEVDGADFLIWQQYQGGIGLQSQGDADGDFNVNSTDYAIWESQLGGATPGTIGWFEGAPNGRGTPMTNGRGTINVVQNSPTNDDTSVSFSIVNSTDVSTFCSGSGGSLCTGSGSGGLIMNNLNGNAPSDFIDSTSGGSLNMLEMTDNELNDWNEYWITLENNGGLAGNIEVNVYMNGSLTADTFQVTLAAPGNATYSQEDNPYIDFGISSNGGFGSFDMDFLSYKIGIHTPTAAPAVASATVPEPSSVALLTLGIFGFFGTRRR